MTKMDLINILSEKFVNFTKKELRNLVEILLEVLKETIIKEGEIKISGFGKFIVKNKKERMGRNPQTGEKIILPKRNVLLFKPSRILKNTLNEKVSSIDIIKS